MSFELRTRGDISSSLRTKKKIYKTFQRASTISSLCCCSHGFSFSSSLVHILFQSLSFLSHNNSKSGVQGIFLLFLTLSLSFSFRTSSLFLPHSFSLQLTMSVFLSLSVYLLLSLSLSFVQIKFQCRKIVMLWDRGPPLAFSLSIFLQIRSVHHTLSLSLSFTPAQ